MDGESKLWCSTKVDQNGQYLKNQWGFCGEDCENKGEQDEQESQKQTSKWMNTLQGLNAYTYPFLCGKMGVL